MRWTYPSPATRRGARRVRQDAATRRPLERRRYHGRRDDTKTTDRSPAPRAFGAARKPIPNVAVTVKDDMGDKKAMSCGGASIPDLAAVLAQASCEVPNGEAATSPRRT